MLVQVLVSIPVNVLGIVDRQVDPTLQNKDVVLFSVVGDYRLHRNGKSHTKKDLANKVDEVPVASVAFVHFKLQVHCQTHV